jgi:hypothetical protein
MERLGELVELDVVEIGDRPEGHAVAGPVTHLEAAEGTRVGQRFAAVGRGPLEDMDRMLLALIDERSHGAADKVVESASDQGKAERREVVDLGREVQFAQKPREP